MKTRILRVEAPDFVATSTWVKLDGDSTWVCTAASPSIEWVRKTEVHLVKQMLEAKGWKYSWDDGTKKVLDSPAIRVEN